MNSTGKSLPAACFNCNYALAALFGESESSAAAAVNLKWSSNTLWPTYIIVLLLLLGLLLLLLQLLVRLQFVLSFAEQRRRRGLVGGLDATRRRRWGCLWLAIDARLRLRLVLQRQEGPGEKENSCKSF